MTQERQPGDGDEGQGADEARDPSDEVRADVYDDSRNLERLKDNVMLVEDYLARESGGSNPLEAGAPPAAGGQL